MTAQQTKKKRTFGSLVIIFVATILISSLLIPKGLSFPLPAPAPGGRCLITSTATTLCLLGRARNRDTSTKKSITPRGELLILSSPLLTITRQQQQQQNDLTTSKQRTGSSSSGNNDSDRCSGRKRRDVLLLLSSVNACLPALQALVITTTTTPTFFPAQAKCTDLDSCREIGEGKIEKDLRDNPIFKLDSGVRYKILRPGTGIDTVQNDSTLDLAFSVSRIGAGYMFSQGFGYERINAGNGKMVSDAGIDSIRIKMGEGNVPLGIEYALLGMKKGERRRVELPAEVGFKTSNWQPEPLTGRGKSSMMAYKRILEGYGATQPGFPAETIWDIEVLRIR
jgi:FKBP-type peptidyl-prolyl cis-trans isomerase